MDDANKFHHVFAKPGHNLSLRSLGDTDAARTHTRPCKMCWKLHLPAGSLVVDTRSVTDKRLMSVEVLVTVKGTIVAGDDRASGPRGSRRSGSK